MLVGKKKKRQPIAREEKIKVRYVGGLLEEKNKGGGHGSGEEEEVSMS